MARRNKHNLGLALAASLLLHGSLLTLQFSPFDADSQTRGWLWGAQQARAPQGSLRVELRAAPRELSAVPATPLPAPARVAPQLQTAIPALKTARVVPSAVMNAQIRSRKTEQASSPSPASLPSSPATTQPRKSTPALAMKTMTEARVAVRSLPSAAEEATTVVDARRKPEPEVVSATPQVSELPVKQDITPAPPASAITSAPVVLAARVDPETAGPNAPAADELVQAARSPQERALEAQARAQAEEVRRQGEQRAQAQRADALADQLANVLQQQALDELAENERQRAAAEAEKMAKLAEAAARQAALEEEQRLQAEEMLRKEREHQDVLRQQAVAAAEAERQREAERQAEQQRAAAAELARARLAAEQAEELRAQAARQEAERLATEAQARQAAQAAKLEQEARAAATTQSRPSAVRAGGRAPSSAALLRQALMGARQLDVPSQPRPSITAGAAEGVTHRNLLGRNPNEVQLSFYGDSWEDKLRRISNANYPRLPTGQSELALVVSVRIQADGQLLAVVILNGSGDREFDAAVRRLIEMAAPFSAFPPDMKRAFTTVELRRMLRFNGRPPLLISR